MDDKTPNTVLQVMKSRPGPWFVNELAGASGLHSGDLYPALAYLGAAGRVTSEWAEEPKPRRRRYSVAEGN